MRKESKEYIESWQSKLSRHESDDLHDVFETFSGQYNIYARLADDISRLLLANGKIRKRGEDKNAATTNLLLLLPPAALLEALHNHGHDRDIEHLATLI